MIDGVLVFGCFM